MNIQDAIDTIESVAGFTDETTPVGEAWMEVLLYVNRPTPQPPADGEVGELATLFAVGGHCGDGVKITPEQCRRVSDLLQRLASPAYLVINPSPEAIAAPALLQDSAPPAIPAFDE